MQLREIKSPEEIKHSEIQLRARNSDKSKNTRHYVATDDGMEAGFLALDIIPSANYLVMYEIYVPVSGRSKGVGSRMLVEVENKAKALGYTYINLTPEPVDLNISRAKLKRWYRSRGYKERSDMRTEMQKRVTPKAR